MTKGGESKLSKVEIRFVNWFAILCRMDIHDTWATKDLELGNARFLIMNDKVRSCDVPIIINKTASRSDGLNCACIKGCMKRESGT